MLYKKTKVMVRSSDDETNFFDLVSAVLHGDSLAPYLYNLPILLTMNVSRSNKRKWFHIKKTRSR